MLWVISVIDKPNSAEIRAGHRTAHADWIKKNEEVVVFTGPYQSDDGKNTIGSLFIINVDSRSKAQAFVDGEAYNQAGVFESVTIRRAKAGHLHPEHAVEK